MADIIQWANKQGYTLMLTQGEKDELVRLLHQVWGNPFRPVESEHFRIENDDYVEV